MIISFSLSEEVYISLANGRIDCLSDLCVIEILPFAILVLDIADVVASVDTCSQMSYKRRQVIEAWPIALVRIRDIICLGGVDISHL